MEGERKGDCLSFEAGTEAALLSPLLCFFLTFFANGGVTDYNVSPPQLGRRIPFSFARSNLQIHKGGVCGSARLLVLPPYVASCNPGSASGLDGPGPRGSFATFWGEDLVKGLGFQ